MTRRVGVVGHGTLLGFFSSLDLDREHASAVIAGAAQTELFGASPEGDEVLVIRGAPPGIPPDPEVRLVGRSSTGVVQWRHAIGSASVFQLPDGTRMVSDRPTADRLAAALAADPRPPPVSLLEPAASVVEQVVGGWSLTDLLAANEVLTTTTAIYPTQPGADVSALVRCEYRSETLAQRAAADIRLRYRNDRLAAQSYRGNPLRYFINGLDDVRADGPALVLRGVLPSESVRSYLMSRS